MAHNNSAASVDPKGANKKRTMKYGEDTGTDGSGAAGFVVGHDNVQGSALALAQSGQASQDSQDTADSSVAQPVSKRTRQSAHTSACKDSTGTINDVNQTMAKRTRQVHRTDYKEESTIAATVSTVPAMPAKKSTPDEEGTPFSTHAPTLFRDWPILLNGFIMERNPDMKPTGSFAKRKGYTDPLVMMTLGRSVVDGQMNESIDGKNDGAKSDEERYLLRIKAQVFQLAKSEVASSTSEWKEWTWNTLRKYKSYLLKKKNSGDAVLNLPDFMNNSKLMGNQGYEVESMHMSSLAKRKTLYDFFTGYDLLVDNFVARNFPGEVAAVMPPLLQG